jgi:hypothetical protein
MSNMLHQLRLSNHIIPDTSRQACRVKKVPSSTSRKIYTLRQTHYVKQLISRKSREDRLDMHIISAVSRQTNVLLACHFLLFSSSTSFPARQLIHVFSFASCQTRSVKYIVTMYRLSGKIISVHNKSRQGLASIYTQERQIWHVM